MQHKNTSLILTITAWLACSLMIYFRIRYLVNSSNVKSVSLFNWLNFIVITGNYFTIGLFGLASYQNRNNTKRIIAVVLTGLSGLWIAFNFYELYEYPSIFDNLSETTNIVNFIQYTVLRNLPALAFLLVGIAFISTNILRQKRSFYWLLLGGLYFLLSEISYILYGIVQSNFSIPSNTPLNILLESLFIPFAISLILFSIVSHKHLNYQTKEDPKENENLLDRVETIDKWEKIKAHQTLTSMQWLGNFLLAAIPLAGPVLLAIWASDHQNRIRRNWAIMQFWGITAGIGLNALLLGSLLELSDSFSGIFAVLTTVFIIMIIIASILTYNYFQKKPDFEDDQNPNLGTWLSNFVIVGIPVIGLIMLIVWATDSTKELIKKWAVARLIWIAISLLIWVYIYSTYTQIQQIISFTYLQF
ncbi:MAG: hypothetical protein HYZ43_13740 [Flavobacteriia bacterium]|nr:hypothetical protein [Flavobacteriia bacterium]